MNEKNDLLSRLGKLEVLFIDYGNTEVINIDKISDFFRTKKLKKSLIYVPERSDKEQYFSMPISALHLVWIR